MSASQYKPWSDNPDAPLITSEQYLWEKSYFAGGLISSILYGMLIVLFFKCVAALFSPDHRRSERIEWGLVSYTLVTFSLATASTAMNLHIQSIAFIDNRDFPGGPTEYTSWIYFNAINIAPNTGFCLSNWLADGLLLYRCYVFYSRNLWVIAFPCLMYLGSVATGILSLCPRKFAFIIPIYGWYLPWYSVTLSLNIILTIMIVIRLVMCGKNVRAATGSPAGSSGLYKSIATMLIESSALFAVSSLLVIGLWASQSSVTYVFSPILSETQVIASLLIVQRVASNRALTRNAIVTGNINPLYDGGRGESTGGSDTTPSDHPMDLEKYGKDSCELGVVVETTISFSRGEV